MSHYKLKSLGYTNDFHISNDEQLKEFLKFAAKTLLFVVPPETSPDDFLRIIIDTTGHDCTGMSRTQMVHFVIDLCIDIRLNRLGVNSSDDRSDAVKRVTAHRLMSSLDEKDLLYLQKILFDTDAPLDPKLIHKIFALFVVQPDSSDTDTRISLDDFSSGVGNLTKRVEDAFKIMRLQNTARLKELQVLVNDHIADLQGQTASPKVIISTNRMRF